MSYHKLAMDWLIKYLKSQKVKNIAYIMNAAKREVIKNSNFIFNDRERLIEAGFTVDIIDLDKTKSLESFFNKYDIIYVRGGNTFDVLNSFRKSRFDKLLPILLEKGKIYVSSSAGSILLSPSIEIVENDFMSDENLAELKDKSGLGLVDFGVFPHWDDKFEEPLNKLLSDLNINYPIIKLKDNQVIKIKGGRLDVLNI